MALKIGNDGIALAFVTLEVHIGDLDKVAEMTTDEDIASNGD